jgi:hypothetical protein
VRSRLTRHTTAARISPIGADAADRLAFAHPWAAWAGAAKTMAAAAVATRAALEAVTGAMIEAFTPGNDRSCGAAANIKTRGAH